MVQVPPCRHLGFNFCIEHHVRFLPEHFGRDRACFHDADSNATQTIFPHYRVNGYAALRQPWSVHREEVFQSVGPFSGPVTGEWMQLNSNGLAVTLATVFIWFSFPAQLLAQQSRAFQASVLLPEAPRPQLAMVVTEPIAQQVPDIQGQTSHPSSSSALQQETGSISGTVSDAYGDVIPGALVTLDGPVPADRRQVVANDTGGFAFDNLRANASCRITISATGFVTWTAAEIILAPGQFMLLQGVSLKIDGEQTSVTVYGSTEQIAVEQVHIAEQQRVLGIIPNFYVVYDSKNAVPLTTKLKYKLAMRVSVDPVSIVAVTSMAAIKQAADTPDFVQGAKGYGQRVGAIGADSFSDILIGGAVLPSLLHQDPRYFYQGTGTTKLRLRHALFSPFICRGDNGQSQPNYSSLGGDLASSALSNVYYPQSNRGVGLVFGNFAIGTAERMASGFAQEFILRKFTSAAKDNSNTSR
jgi:hypothetical protein